MQLNRDQFVIRPTDQSEVGLFTYSHSIVEAVLTCPVWGIIRYVENKQFPNTGRAMALDAGHAMHEVFGAVRLWQLLRKQNLPGHFFHHGVRLFGEERFTRAWKPMKDERDELLSFAFRILNSGSFEDDPNDTIRTIANMEETTIRYVDEMRKTMHKNPIWVEDIDNPTAPVGIEVVFDVVVVITDSSHPWADRKVRYIGTIDGIIQRAGIIGVDASIRVDENKTASRLDDAWRLSFQVKSQPRGYAAVAELFTNQPCPEFRLIGTKVKQTRSEEDVKTFTEPVLPNQVADWAKTLFHADEIVRAHLDDPLNAPKYTHSCSRYFRACSFINLCGADPLDQLDIYASMIPGDLTPSQAALRRQAEGD